MAHRDHGDRLEPTENEIFLNSHHPFNRGDTRSPLVGSPLFKRNNPELISLTEQATFHEIPQDSQKGLCHTSQTMALFISGLGMMTNYFNLASLTTAKTLMSSSFGPPTTPQDSLLTSASLAGAVLGQLCFGFIADQKGVRTTSLLTSTLSTIGAACTLFTKSQSGTPHSAYSQLILGRFLQGLGFGGDYPVCSTITAENASAKDSTSALTFNAIMLNGGGVLAQLAYIATIPECTDDESWRIVTALGLIMSFTGLVLRASFLEEAPQPSESDTTGETQRTSEDEDQSPFEIQHAVETHNLVEIQNTVEPHNALDTQSCRDAPFQLNNHNGLDTQSDLEANLASHFQVSESLITPHSPNVFDIRKTLPTLAKPLLGVSLNWMLYDAIDFCLSMYSSEILGSPKKPFESALLTLGTNGMSLLGCVLAYPLLKSNALSLCT